MNQPTPIACTLEPTRMAERADEVRALGRAGLRAIEPGERRVTLRFDPAASAAVERIVAAESDCCAFLDFALDREATATVLTIAAPEGAELALQALADLFVADAEVTPSRPWSASP